MTDELVRVTFDPRGFARLTLNNPSVHNALDDVIITSLTNHLRELQSNPDVRVIILASNGQHFSAGADLNWMKRMVKYSQEENILDATNLVTLLKTLSLLEKPIIALAQGVSMGGAIGLLACCDIVLAASDAVFCFPEAKLGLVPATIAPYVIQAIGARAARYLFLTAKYFSVEEAKTYGLVHKIVEAELLRDAGIEKVNAILRNGPEALSTIKKITCQPPLDEATLHQTAVLLASIRTSAEAQEGIKAFFDKRAPTWLSQET